MIKIELLIPFSYFGIIRMLIKLPILSSSSFFPIVLSTYHTNHEVEVIIKTK